MPRIRQLPDSLVNQIAAGEVVERPSSVVKELAENALDAEARSIRVRLEGGGRDLVEVIDDGYGMEAEDATLAVMRHATSKITSEQDLAAIMTLGFRGEALPSIAAAAHLVLETATGDGEGTRVEVEFGGPPRVEPCAQARGTHVIVRDLFARLPARRKFLRTQATELRHTLSALTGLAFANPAVAFTVDHAGRRLLTLPSARDARQRLPDLLGAAKARGAVEVAHESAAIAVSGFLVPGAGSREIVVVVNGRVVRDRLLVSAVNRALQGGADVDRAEVFLDLRMPATEVDVNVHPAKSEVRFAEPGRIFAALAGALAQARARLVGPVPVRRIVTVSSLPARATALPFPPPARPFEARPAAPAEVGETATRYEAGQASDESAPIHGSYLGQYRATYLLVEDDAGLLLVDQHVAHERVLYERLLSAPVFGAVQGLLLPEVVELGPSSVSLAEELHDELRRVGLEIEPASGGSVRILGVPAALPPGSAARLLERLLADLAGGTLPGDTVHERVAASLACQAAIKKNTTLSRQEAERLLAELATATHPHRCPHGRPISLRIAHLEIERRIGRR